MAGVPLATPPMEAEGRDELPTGPGWRFEPKWDGFRCLAFKQGSRVELRAKSGKPLGRYFPEVVTSLAAAKPDRFVLDGELVIPAGDVLSFDALQMRLHPAESRIRKLARETPARFVLFDCLSTPRSGPLLEEPLSQRRMALEALVTDIDRSELLRLSPWSADRDQAQGWFGRVGGALDGVVAKQEDEPYRPGERAMIKVKWLRTADCVVGGFRYDRAGKLVASLLLGLYDHAGLLNHVGFTSGLAGMDKKALTAKLEALVQPPGFTGSAPGGPSRWSTERSAEWRPLRPELVVEVRYDHVTGDRFRHGTGLVRWRPDKAPGQCTMEQLGREARPSRVVSAVTG
jgi:ATP-dependent DNA ligase